MSESQQFIQGEFNRKIDERFRLTLPKEFAETFKPKSGSCVIAKERPGCLSLWEEDGWKEKQDKKVEFIQQKMAMPGQLEHRTMDLQRFGRLLSTHHRLIQLKERSRLMLPEGFREFLAVEPGGEVIIVGAILCIEIWHPAKWINYLESDMQEFDALFNSLLDSKPYQRN